MKNTVIISMILWVIAMMICMGCGIDQEEYDRLAKEEYLRKANELKKERLEICNKDADMRAEVIADSIIRQMAINPLKDEQYRPDVPPRPTYVPTDSAAINSKRSVKPLVTSAQDKR